MKRLSAFFLAILFLALSLASCDFSGSGNDTEKINDALPSASGAWHLMGDEDTFFTLNGEKGVMSFSYTEDGEEKYHGTFRAVYRGVGEDIQTPLTLLLTRSDKDREDWLDCYTECFKDDFTQFTVMGIEEDLGVTDGTVYTHIYRISELPYKIGTYLREGAKYKEEKSLYRYADSLHVPSGTYALPSGESFTFVMSKPMARELFRYQSGETAVEGTLWIAEDQKTAYLYVEHDPYSKVTKADKAHYDTTFDICYPPDFYLRGSFGEEGRLVIDGLYRHPESPTEISDETWVFGTYEKTEK